MKMIDNYLATLCTYLPESMQQDVRDELEASIYGQLDDIAEQKGRDVNELEQAQILEQLGHPMQVAASYLPNQQLIGQAFFPMFKKVLQTTFMIVTAIHLFMSLPYLANSSNFIGAVIRTFWGLMETGVWLFGFITLIFYAMQLSGFDPKRLYTWSAFELKDRVDGKPVSRFESLFELAMQVLFLAWWNNVLSWPVNDITAERFRSITLSQQWESVVMPVNIIIGLVMLITVHKLWVCGWNTINRVGNIVANLLILALMWHILGFDPLVEINNQAQLLSEHAVNTIELSIKAVLWIIVFVNLWEMFASGRKLLRR